MVKLISYYILKVFGYNTKDLFVLYNRFSVCDRIILFIDAIYTLFQLFGTRDQAMFMGGCFVFYLSRRLNNNIKILSTFNTHNSTYNNIIDYKTVEGITIKNIEFLLTIICLDTIINYFSYMANVCSLQSVMVNILFLSLNIFPIFFSYIVSRIKITPEPFRIYFLEGIMFYTQCIYADINYMKKIYMESSGIDITIFDAIKNSRKEREIILKVLNITQ